MQNQLTNDRFPTKLLHVSFPILYLYVLTNRELAQLSKLIGQTRQKVQDKRINLEQ
jgi:hypothetical protein